MMKIMVYSINNHKKKIKLLLIKSCSNNTELINIKFSIIMKIKTFKFLKEIYYVIIR